MIYTFMCKLSTLRYFITGVLQSHKKQWLCWALHVVSQTIIHHSRSFEVVRKFVLQHWKGQTTGFDDGVVYNTLILKLNILLQ